ncbi:MAG: penicillin-binding protein 2 [Rhodospirillales bacterium]|nr:penicillin-binding protein 2 [Rhodospirillales bacterium]
MSRDNERHKTLSRRSLFLFGGQIALLSGLVGRMYYLQVVESEKFKTLADENRISYRIIAPKRGRILDRYGRLMAINKLNYRVMMVPENVNDLKQILEKLTRIIDLSRYDLLRLKRDIKRYRSFTPILLKENLEWDKIAKIEVNTEQLEGIFIDVGEQRFYPSGSAVAAVCGYVSQVTDQQKKTDPLFSIPGFKVGKSGMEKFYDIALRGKSGSKQIEVNAFGRQIRELEKREGEEGKDVWLTIDLELQKYVSQRLARESASCVVMDIHKGDLLALVSTPSFDPNAFNRGLTKSEWQKILNNSRNPLNNKAISGQYAPGSTFKMVVALAALEKGIISNRSNYFCTGSLELGDSIFHCWKKNGHGKMNMISAIAQSCDVYFYEVAKRLGIDAISSMARRLGLGQIFNIELSGEAKGLMPTREWKKKNKNSSWQQGETLLAGIGQGLILATPLQLAVMTSRIVNGGKAVTPRLTKGISLNKSDLDSSNNSKLGNFKNIGINITNLDLVKKSMSFVTNSPQGTAFRARIIDPKYRFGGKTGTVQVRRISAEEREIGVKKNKDLEWHERDHALFVGYAPLSNPRYVVSVVVEHGGGGSTVAAPLARDILLKVQKTTKS